MIKIKMGGLILSALLIGSNTLAVTAVTSTAESKVAAAHSADAVPKSGFRKACTKGCEYAYFACGIGGVVVNLYAMMMQSTTDHPITMPDRIISAVGAVDIAQDLRNSGKSMSEIIDPNGSIIGRKWGRTRRICRYVYGCSKFLAMIVKGSACFENVANVHEATEASHRALISAGALAQAASTLFLWKSFWRGNKKQPESAMNTVLSVDGDATVVSKAPVTSREVI